MTHEQLVKIVAKEISGAPFPSSRSVAKARSILSLVAEALGEPKAWRVRIGDSDVWGFSFAEWDADFWGAKSGLHYVKEPLFDASPLKPDSQPPVDGV